MKKGEIWIVELPPLGGHEQVGTRPAIVLSDTKSSVVVVIPCTSNIQALRFPFTILISPSKANSLEVDSVALVLHIRAIDRRRLKRKIGTVGKAVLADINKTLKQLLDL